MIVRTRAPSFSYYRLSHLKILSIHWASWRRRNTKVPTKSINKPWSQINKTRKWKLKRRHYNSRHLMILVAGFALIHLFQKTTCCFWAIANIFIIMNAWSHFSIGSLAKEMCLLFVPIPLVNRKLVRLTSTCFLIRKKRKGMNTWH